MHLFCLKKAFSYLLSDKKQKKCQIGRIAEQQNSKTAHSGREINICNDIINE